MTQDNAINLILEERKEQNRKHPQDERRIRMYRMLAPHILLLEELTAKARTDWYRSSPISCLGRIIQIGAVALRALEEIEPQLTSIPVDASPCSVEPEHLYPSHTKE